MSQRATPFVGAHVLESLTSGMYDDPLMVYREYIQNAVDSIDRGVSEGLLDSDDASIRVHIDGMERCVTIEDNGPGIPLRDAPNVLMDIGNSQKSRHEQRGFRGIGRLGGLGYCKVLRFETRSPGERQVTIVDWDGDAVQGLPASPNQQASVQEAVSQACSVFNRPATADDPVQFFRVTIKGVRPFYDDAIMNIKKVRHYLSQVAPVPYNHRRFSHGQQLNDFLRDIKGYRAYKVHVNGEPVKRPYVDEFHVSEKTRDQVEGVELFELEDAKGDCLARGWYAKTSLAGSLPKSLGVHGIRVRQGNIQIGDEQILARYFAESRFSGWHIGEIHLANGHLTPNARRDGFEPSPGYERFLQYATMLGRHLSAACRRAASQRSAERRAQAQLADLEAHAERIPVNADEHAKNIASATEIYESVVTLVEGARDGKQVVRAAETALEAVKNSQPVTHLIDGRKLRHKTKRTLIEEVCATIAEHYDEASSAADLIEHVVGLCRTRKT